MVADVLAVGLTTLDILGHPIDALPAEEGGALISGIDVVPAGTAGGFALVASVLGLKTGLISALGQDRPGRFVRLVLEEHGVDTSLVPTLDGFPTSATILPIDSHGRRPTLHAVGASMLIEITAAAIAAASRARFIHWAAIGGVRIDPQARAEFLQAGRRAGATITCDLIAPGPKAAAEIAAILPAVDCFMPSLAEARFLTGHSEAEAAAAELLAMGARRCIVKLGAAGVLVASAQGMERIAAFDVQVVDTTSCGDAFCAGYVAGLDRGWGIAESCRFAAATSALVAQGLGTLGRLEGFAQALQAAATMKLRTAP
jgi:sugar/nucleoside kinase (ribokinase family)